MERDPATGLNSAVERVENPGTGRWTSQDPIGFAGGSRDLYGYVSNEPTDGADASGLYFAKYNIKTGWKRESPDDVLKRLAKQMGGPLRNPQELKNQEFWRQMDSSNIPIEVKFLNMAGNPNREGGRTYFDGFSGGVMVNVGPDMANDPNQLLSNFLHEMIHASLLAGCNFNFGGNPVKDLNADPENYKTGTGYGKYPGTNDQNDINQPGQGLINDLSPKIAPRQRFRGLAHLRKIPSPRDG